MAASGFVLIHSFSMALRPILCFPDPRLRTVAKPFGVVDARARALIDDMLETMYDAKGIGLAATQVDVHERLIVLDLSEQRNEPMVLINPEVVWASDEKMLNEEGCLSVPGIYDGVERPVAVHVRAQDRDGRGRLIEAEGLLAVCIQHEMDHLDGILMTERLDDDQRREAKAAVRRLQLERAEPGPEERPRRSFFRLT